MFKIEVTTDRGAEFGVIAEMPGRTTDDGYPVYGISRQIGNPAIFETEGEARQVVRTFENNTMCDHFGFNVVAC